MELTHEIKNIPVDEIKTFLGRERNKRDFSQIVENIQQIGLKIPITIRKIKPKKKKGRSVYRYELIKGHGRLIAVQQLGWQTVPAFVVNSVDECEIVKLFLMENEVRKSLTAAERAVLMEQDFKRNVPVSELARKYGFKENTVYSYLATLEALSPKINKLLADKDISLDTARIVSSFDKDEQDSLASAIKGEKLKNVEYLTSSMRAHKDKHRIKITRGVLRNRIQEVRVQFDEKKKELSAINEEWIDVVGGIKTLLEDLPFVKLLNKHGVNYTKFVRT